MADILLGYESTDRQRVAPIVALLETRGWSVEAEPAGDAAAHGGAAGSGAACVIAAWSFDSVESDAVWAIAGHGLATGTLVSVSIDFSRPPKEFNDAPSLALAGWIGDEASPKAQELLAAVDEIIARAPPKAAAPLAASTPVANFTPVAEPAPAPAVEPASEPFPKPTSARSLAQALAKPPTPTRSEANAAQEELEAEEEEIEAQPIEPRRTARRDDDWPPFPAPETRAFERRAATPREDERRLRWQSPFDSRRQIEAEIEVDFDAAEPAPEPVPALVLRDGASQPVWTFPEEAGSEEEHSPDLPPVLLRERGMPVLAPAAEELEEEVAPEPARRGLAVPLAGLAACLVIAAAAGAYWVWGWPDTRSGGEVAAVDTASKPAVKLDAKPAASQSGTAPAAPVQASQSRPPETTPRAESREEARPQEAKAPEIKPAEPRPPQGRSQDAKPQEIQPTPAALPKEPNEKDVAIEDILGQVTPKVEQLLTNARRLIRAGDFRGARQVLAAPETAQSGTLTFLLAETYDPNMLPAAQKSALADPGRARVLYRKARELGDGRAQSRLDALKTS